MSQPRPPKDYLAFAADYPILPAASEALAVLGPEVGWVKVGLELYLRAGSLATEEAKSRGNRLFLDLKLHDIPATVGRATKIAADRGADLLTIHAQGGPRMIEAALQAAEATNPKMRIAVVTVLTSLGAEELQALGLGNDAKPLVERYAKLAYQAGARAFVCSALEAKSMRQWLGDDAFLITPGIRLPGGDKGDQTRVATPESAIADGSDLLVVGRPLRDAPNPAAVAQNLLKRIETAIPGGA